MKNIIEIYYYYGYLSGIFLCLVSGLLVIRANPKSLTNKLWGVLSFFVGIWFFGRFMIFNSGSIEEAYFWQKINYSGSIFLTIVYCHFIYSFIGKPTRNFFLLLGYTIASILFLSNIFTNKFISTMKYFENVGFFEQAGPLYIVHQLLYLIYPSVGYFYLVKQNKVNPLVNQNQIRYLVLASNIGFLSGLTTFPLVFGIKIPPIGGPITSIYVLIVAYAIIIYRLMDFNLIMRWGLGIGFTVITMATFFLGGTFVLISLMKKFIPIEPLIIFIIMAAFSVFLFDPLRVLITRYVDRIIFKAPDFQSLLLGIETELLKSASLEDFTNGLAFHLKNIWKTEQAWLVLWDSKKGSYNMWPKMDGGKTPLVEIEQLIQRNDFLIRTLESERRLFKYGIITYYELNHLSTKALPGEKVTFEKIKRTMRWVKASICIPIFSENNIFLGFISLGNKPNNNLYNEEDKKFLTHVASMVNTKINNFILN